MQDKKIRYLDSEANNHICEDKNRFMKLDEAIRGNVIFLNDSKLVIKEKKI